MSPAQAVDHVVGPFKGMRYTLDSVANDPEYAYLSLDLLPADQLLGGAYLRRPSDQNTQVKASSNPVVQHLGVYKQRAASLTVAVVDGELYTFTVAGGWVLRVTIANLTTASITLSATARVFATTFADVYVVNDGVNRPFTWNGTSGAGGLVSLTNAPSRCYGAPTVYFGKLFFIKDVAAASADRSTLVWSEENLPNTGYEAGGFNNAWILSQSGAGALYAIVGTNTALYYFRAAAIGSIRGAVTPDFASAGTHDDVADGLGTTCPSVLWYDGYLYFFDRLLRPHRVGEGLRPEPLWLNVARRFTGPDAGTTSWVAAKSTIALYPWTNGVSFGIFDGGANNGTTPIFVFGHLSGAALCQLTFTKSSPFARPQLLGPVYDEANDRLALGAGLQTTTNAQVTFSPVGSGEFYDHTLAQGPGLLVGPIGRTERDILWSFIEIVAEFVLGATVSPRIGTMSAVYSSGENDAQVTLFGSDVDAVLPATSAYETHIRQVWGRMTELRWTMVQIAPGVANALEGWGVHRVTVKGLPFYPGGAKR